jgi:hypothetical protein
MSTPNWKAEMMDAASGSTNMPITIHDRLEVGNFTVDEVCRLKCLSRVSFYSDVRAGLVEIRKLGRKTVVPGPSVRKYLGLST